MKHHLPDERLPSVALFVLLQTTVELGVNLKVLDYFV